MPCLVACPSACKLSPSPLAVTAASPHLLPVPTASSGAATKAAERDPSWQFGAASRLLVDQALRDCAPLLHNPCSAEGSRRAGAPSGSQLPVSQEIAVLGKGFVDGNKALEPAGSPLPPEREASS